MNLILAGMKFNRYDSDKTSKQWSGTSKRNRHGNRRTRKALFFFCNGLEAPWQIRIDQ